LLSAPWLPLLGLVDALVAPSEYIRHALCFAENGAFIVQGLNTLELPAGFSPGWERFGLAAEDAEFVTEFEFARDPSRENTDAVIDAFRRAFPATAAARLVSKVNNATSEAARRGLERMRGLAGGDPRVRLLTEPMSDPKVLTLYCSAEVYVSLHRAEDSAWARWRQWG
jgi:hypothetical protein